MEDFMKLFHYLMHGFNVVGNRQQMLLSVKLQESIDQHKFIAEHYKISLSAEPDSLPCLSDIIMNIRAPIINAKARRKDCKGKYA